MSAATLIVAADTNNAFRRFAEGDILGISILLAIAFVMIAYWVWKDRRSRE